MSRRHNKQPKAAKTPNLPSFVELERFSEADIKVWKKAQRHLSELAWLLYFDLEKLRTRHADELVDALKANGCGRFDFNDWCRIVDYQYSLTPLSVAGSLATEGGRFNIGRRLNEASFPPFPALYIASDHDTAFVEKFQIRRDAVEGGLSANELLLRKPSSFSFLRLRGSLELCFDVGDVKALQAFVDIIKKFPLPANVSRLARALNMPPTHMIRTVQYLQKQLLEPDWMANPLQFDLPANSQIFGRLLNAAGYHGVLYPSVRNKGGRCIALFPQNWRGSTSFVEICDVVPEGTNLSRLDKGTPSFE